MKKTKHLLVIKSLIFCSLIISMYSHAQIFSYTDNNGVIVLTNKKPDTSKFAVTNHGCFGTCVVGVDWKSTPLKPSKFADEVNTAANTFNVDKALVRAIMHAESWFQPSALSKAGAQGLMQLMPATQARFGVEDAHDPMQNIYAGTEYLAWLMNEFDSDINKVIAAYNAGENAVKRYDGVPPFSETREYLRRVNILYARYSSE